MPCPCLLYLFRIYTVSTRKQQKDSIIFLIVQARFHLLRFSTSVKSAPGICPADLFPANAASLPKQMRTMPWMGFRDTRSSPINKETLRTLSPGTGVGNFWNECRKSLERVSISSYYPPGNETAVEEPVVLKLNRVIVLSQLLKVQVAPVRHIELLQLLLCGYLPRLDAIRPQELLWLPRMELRESDKLLRVLQ